MTAEKGAIDPYDAVLADLRAKRDQIDQTIRMIEAHRGGNAPAAKPFEASLGGGRADEEGPGAFLGMSIPDAAKKLLGMRKRAMSNGEIASGIQSGGLVMKSADPQNTVGSVLTRRFNENGDIVRVGRGVWGLAEWYPNRNFKKKPDKDGSGAKVETSEPE